jgi:hypothetical protein
MGRNVAPLGQNILIPIQPLLHLNASWDSEKQQMLILHIFLFATPLQFLLVDKVFQSLWFLSGCPGKDMCDSIEATNPRLLVARLK